MKKITSQLTVALVCGLLGFMLTYQFKLLANQDTSSNVDNKNSTEITAEIDALKKSKQDLENKNNQLTDQIKKYEDSATLGNGTNKSIKDELDKSRILLGYTDVQGQGIILYLTPKSDLFSSGKPQYIDHRELTYLVNELNFAGAEAISINDERITEQTGIKLSGNNYILVNGDKISPSQRITIKAIGDKTKLQQSLKFAGVFDYLDLPNYTYEISTSDSIKIPKYNKDYKSDYLNPSK